MLQSCLDLPYKRLQVFVVDNASSDGSVTVFNALAKKEKRLCVFPLPSNIGFSAGNNVALKEVTSQYAMLLNSDAYFTKSADIEPMIDFLDQHPDVGMLTPKVVLNNGSLDPASHRGFPTPYRALTYFSGLEKVTKKVPILNRFFGGYHETWKNLHEIHEIDACTGAAMVLRREAIDEVGLLDERFFMYGEDLDWCYRFKELEWKILFFPMVTVIHDKHSSGIKKGRREKPARNAFNIADAGGDKEKEGHAEIRSKTKDAFYDAMVLFYKKHDLGPPWMENLVLLGIKIVQRIRK